MLLQMLCTLLQLCVGICHCTFSDKRYQWL